ncbi:MAG: HAMP domain-containing histidine kinase, partial [Lachnospiraceae bacterium]|nr:HAMP domain-containing histidine kinase [Lachnospiraceae bacterium]
QFLENLSFMCSYCESITYAEDVYVDAKRSGLNSWRVYYTVSFADGDALVYIYDGEAETYYHILLALSVLGGFIACMAIFISGMQEDVQYIQIFENEVKGIRAGDLKSQVTIQGEDELASLALGLDQMRRSLEEKEQTEAELRKTQEEMRRAQEKLVLGMSHDIRTPLTGLMTYMEIIKKQEAEGKPDPVYIEKAYDKILQIKTLSDQMFEFFLIDSKKESELEPPEDVFSVFGDYLSELCGVLDAKGYHIDANGLAWESVSVRVNTDYMGRIMNNIISNIEKYADKDQDITVSVFCGNDRVDISIGNKIAGANPYVEGTGIGVKNISMMMRQMNGASKVAMTEDSYCITLSFPAVDAEG